MGIAGETMASVHSLIGRDGSGPSDGLGLDQPPQ